MAGVRVDDVAYEIPVAGYLSHGGLGKANNARRQNVIKYSRTPGIISCR